jgi:hypothetical protein
MTPNYSGTDPLVASNPWWVAPGAIAADPHIRSLQSGPFVWTPPAMSEIPLRPGSVHTLRGPRQVGKTTTAKRLIEQLLQRGERRVLYYSFDLETDNAAIPRLIQHAKAATDFGPGPWYLFLDEVTAIPEWQRGVKFAWDQGLIREDFVLCTGSSARRMGTEQLPGRRGEGRDFLQLTVSFRDFCRYVRRIELPESTVLINEWISASGAAAARRLNLQQAELSAALDAYMRVGGFPAALRDYVNTGAVTYTTVAAVWAMIANEVRQAQLDPTAALKLIERVARSLGSPLSWTAAAESMGAASHHTAQSYVKALAESFALLVIHHWDLHAGFEPRKQRKVYFLDPLFADVHVAAASGSRTASADGMLEGIVASALFRSASEHLTQSDPTLGSIGYWRSRDGREIDFVVDDPDTLGGVRRLPIEVKGDAPAGINAAVSSMRRTFKRGIVVSRTVFDLRDDIAVLPAPVFLAGLPERTARRLSTL